MKTWVKVYTEINRDPDIGTLTWAQRGIWTALLALAGEIDDRDEDERETGVLDTVQRVAWSIRCDTDELREAVSEFEERGMIAGDFDGVLYLPNYPKRQGRPPSSRPTAVAERVQRHRDKSKAECNDVTGSVQRGVTPSDTDTDTEADKKQIQIQTTTEGETAGVAVAVQALENLGMSQPEKVMTETQLTPAQVVDVCAYAEQQKLGAGWARNRLRANEHHQPRAPDDDRRKYLKGEWADIIEH